MMGSSRPLARSLTFGSTRSDASQRMKTVATTIRYSSRLNGSPDGSVYLLIGMNRIVSTIKLTSDRHARMRSCASTSTQTPSVTGATTRPWWAAVAAASVSAIA